MSTVNGAGGLRLSYRTLGNGPTLVCHPGGPGAAGAYVEHLGGLDAERTLIVLDPRGTGASERPPDGVYELDPNAADLEALREHLGLEQLELIGHSFGGFVSILYAAAYPERLRRLVLVGTLVRFSDEVRAQEPFAVAADELRALRPDIPVELVPDAGHFCWVEQPEVFRRLVTEFLNS